MYKNEFNLFVIKLMSRKHRIEKTSVFIKNQTVRLEAPIV